MPGVNRLYIGAGRRSLHSGSAGGLGPNLLLTPNGPFTSGNWTPNQVTETTGQTDPLSGTTASLMTDTAAAAQHYWFQAITFAQVKYQVTGYIKPGTYTGNICFVVGTGNQCQLNFDTVAHTAANGGGITPATNIVSTSVANGFWKVTFNFVESTGGGGSLTMGFNANIGSYTGTLQNVTVWGFAVQTST